MTVKIEASDALRNLATIERRVLDAVRIGIADAGKVALVSAQGTTVFRDRTGQLRKSIAIIDTGAFSKRLIARAAYAAYVNAGTKAHVILPRNAPFLRFVIAGRTIFARRVRHPGTQPRPFMDAAGAAGSQAMRVILDDETERAVAYP